MYHTKIMGASETVLNTIRLSGNRITEPRRLVVAVLAKCAQPLTIQQIKSHVKVDEVSVYRTVALLRSLGLVEEIADAQSTRRFALVSEHHHHVVCKQCGYVAHIPCQINDEPELLQHPKFYHIVAHEVTYYGICRACSTQG